MSWIGRYKAQQNTTNHEWCEYSLLNIASVIDMEPALLVCYDFHPAWISNHILSKVWDEITYHFPNFNSATVEVCYWIIDLIGPTISP